ncbi:MAG: hypothetical protein ACR2NR_22710 [Solirubrobacteraceae bacterium]
MLFQLVLEGNPSRRLWERMEFVEVGRVPDAFNGQAALCIGDDSERPGPNVSRGRVRAGIASTRAEAVRPRM